MRAMRFLDHRSLATIGFNNGNAGRFLGRNVGISHNRLPENRCSGGAVYVGNNEVGPSLTGLFAGLARAVSILVG